MKNTYYEKMEEYKEEDYFSKCTIVINYVYNSFLTRPDKRKYIVTSVELKEIDDDFKDTTKEPKESDVKLTTLQRLTKKPVDDLKTSLKKLVDRCNVKVSKASKRKSWQIFYVYKELLQSLTGKDLGFNYFRGQSCDKPLLPGIMRLGVDIDYIHDFDSIYKKLSYEFPDKLDYTSIEDSNIVERESNLSLLQHYGLKTALLDITKNPYIAMLFMLKENSNDNEYPTLYLFKIDDYNVNNEHPTLFTEVKKSQINERIIAQKGAFLNFEKAILSDTKLTKIPYVKIVLNYDIEEYNRLIDKELKEYNRLIDNEIETTNKASETAQETFDNIYKWALESEKVDCISSREASKSYIINEMEKKLKEIFYNKEDMFPDFENRIRYLSNKYRKDDIQDKNYNK